MNSIKKILAAVILASSANYASATLIDFEGGNEAAALAAMEANGVTIGGGMTWNGVGGGHLWLNAFPSIFTSPSAYPDTILFASETYVNSFQLNAMPWEGAERGIESLGINAYNGAGDRVWSTSFNDIAGVSELSAYTDWADWLTVSVETAGIMRLEFIQNRGPGGGNNSFFPSIDNLVINEVSEPSALALFGLGLIGLGFARKKKTL